jgi:hypothetical protein
LCFSKVIETIGIMNISLTINNIFIGLTFIVIVLFSTFPSSLWLDEAALAVNLVCRPIYGLIDPLEYDQVAPIGFLIATKVFISSLPINDFTIRLITITALILLMYLLTKAISNGRIYILLILLNFGFFRFGFEMKQYIFDVLFLTYYYYVFPKDVKTNYLFIILFLSWFSTIALVLYIPLFILIIIKNYNKKSKFYFLFFLCLFVFNFIIYYFLFIKNHPAEKTMSVYWSSYFMPLNWNILYWLFYRIWEVFCGLVYTPFIRLNWILGSVILASSIIALIGVVIRTIRSKSINLYSISVVLPFIVHLGLSALSKFPFAPGRLTIYLAIPIIFGLSHYYKNYLLGLNKKLLLITNVVLLLLVFSSIVKDKVVNPPENIKNYIKNQSNDEITILMYSSIKAYDYYKSINYNSGNFIYCTNFQVLSNLNIPTRIKSIKLIETHSKRLNTDSKDIFISRNTSTYKLVKKTKGRGIWVFYYTVI